jgi:magnesium chelatase family protein
LVLDAMRQPLEERVVRIARQGATVAFPADFLLIACSNPCPCGLGPPRCICSEALRLRYRRRLSAPLIDRFDLRVALGPASPNDPTGPPSQAMNASPRRSHVSGIGTATVPGGGTHLSRPAPCPRRSRFHPTPRTRSDKPPIGGS